MMPVGNMEVWLGEVERRMKASIRTQVDMACNMLLTLYAVVLASHHVPEQV